MYLGSCLDIELDSSTMNNQQNCKLDHCNHWANVYCLISVESFINTGPAFILINFSFPCRGIRASSSLSFLEVVVACEVAETSSSSECIIDETENGRTRTIYLHLKKFFRGTRFTFQPFLRSLEGKHKEGDIVCVSGKVSLWIISFVEIFALQVNVGSIQRKSWSCCSHL